MSQQAQSSDSPRHPAVLDLSPLTWLETATFLNIMTDAQRDIEDSNFAISYPLWNEIVGLRLEARAAFLHKFFEV